MSSLQGAGNNHPFEVSPPGHKHYEMEAYPTDSIIINQPISTISESGNWAQVPRGIPASNPGLEYLGMIDQLIVHQKIEVLEMICGCETKNKYVIKNSMGQEVGKATEDTDCCNRNCCGNLRPFEMNIEDNSGTEIIHFSRDLRCASCCFPCCLQRLEVYAPPGHLVGVVCQEWSLLTPNFSVQTPDEEVLFRIDGSICPCSCCCQDVDFPIHSEENGRTVGKITKQWSGLGRETFTDADHFGITFPLELEISKKATLLGALFLIDFLYFEHPK